MSHTDNWYLPALHSISSKHTTSTKETHLQRLFLGIFEVKKPRAMKNSPCSHQKDNFGGKF